VTYLTTGPATDCREPEDESDGLPDPDELQPADPPSVLSGGVGLSRLIGLARLTAPQALEIGASVLAEAAGRSEPDSGSPGSDQVEIEQVLIGTDGRVVLAPTADSRHNGRPSSAAGPTGLAVEAVLGDVARAARLGARRTEPAAEQLLVVLDRAVAELPVAGVPAVAEMLREAAAATDRGAIRAELAALVGAVGRSAGSASGSEPADDLSTVVRVAPAWPATSGRTGTARRRIGAWLLSIVVLAAVVLLEVALLRDHIATDIRLLLGAGRSGSASSSPEPDGPPIVPPAPAAAGSVTAVDLRPLARCAPGAPCTMRLLVRLVPAVEPQVVTWSYRIVDRCTGATATDPAPGGSVTVPAGGERAAALGTVTLPAADAVAVVAVTDLPAAAASPPAFVGACPPD
jgi:hypothetical protein